MRHQGSRKAVKAVQDQTQKGRPAEKGSCYKRIKLGIKVVTLREGNQQNERMA